MTDHTQSRHPWAPTITTEDIHRRRAIGARSSNYHVQVIGKHPSGDTVRFTLPFISDYTEHLAFTVEVFDPARRAWNPLWTIPGSTYRRSRSEGDDRDAEKDPTTNVIASRYDFHIPDHRATSWQKIINALADRADEILPAQP
ncbi:hypothetical protein KO481_16965 [Nocardia sp. NEAU-G5]|uniref:Polyketide cyclase n=1 Tax=Nocardia albiluteola TaxID=2842303 RepID=A0ABS6AYT8_9NOCA|nr:hypothetical protein [Nocardia albiluteola]MBU3063213.1 hypothetical protein [Nocardia albiluteola]